MASKRNGTIYVGSTSERIKRAWEHKNNVRRESFTAQYNAHKLDCYEIHESYMEAARREQRFKNGCRKWTLHLIENMNPKWNDHYEAICR